MAGTHCGELCPQEWSSLSSVKHFFRKFFNLVKASSSHFQSSNITPLYICLPDHRSTRSRWPAVPISFLSPFPASFLQTLTLDFRPRISVAVSRFSPRVTKDIPDKGLGSHDWLCSGQNAVWVKTRCSLMRVRGLGKRLTSVYPRTYRGNCRLPWWLR